MAGMRFAVRFCVWVSLLAPPVFGIAQTAATQTATNGVAEIVSALRTGQFDRALQLLQPQLEQNPKNAQLWTLKGIALRGKGDKQAGLEAFHHALEISPDYLPALEGAAQIGYETSAKETPGLLRHILELHPEDQTSHAMLAVLAYRRGDCATAIAHFEQSGPLLDSQSGALRQYGDCLVSNKEFDKAVAVFDRALAKSNGDMQARFRLASVQIMANRPKDAIATMQPQVNENTTDADTLELTASAFEEDGNTPEAVRLLRKAIIANPHDVRLYVDFANISFDHESYQVGVDMINFGLEKEPKAALLYLTRGVLYVQLAQFDRAEADFEKAGMLDPRQSIASAAEGLAAVQENDPAKTLATVRQKLAQKPDDPYLLDSLAEILAQRGPDPGSAEFREAMEAARKAIALRPSLGTASDLLAKLELQSGQNEAAAEQCRKSLAIDPKDQTALYHLIQALRKSGKQQELPDLLKRLAALRMEGTKDEAERNRFKLVEEKSPEKELP